MNGTVKAAVTLGADVGGTDADVAMKPHYMKLRKALERWCTTTYTSELQEFAIILRIDGSVQSWGKRGVDFIRLQKKKGYATADIFVPAALWQAGVVSDIRGYLAEQSIAALVSMLEKVKQAKIPIDAAKLLADANSAVEDFLAS